MCRSFVDPSLLPQSHVRIAAFDGENADPANGRRMEEGLLAYTPWGEIAYALAGASLLAGRSSQEAIYSFAARPATSLTPKKGPSMLHFTVKFSQTSAQRQSLRRAIHKNVDEAIRKAKVALAEIIPT